MTQIVVVVEKPSVARVLAGPLRQHFPDAQLHIVFAPFVFSRQNVVAPRYPRGLTLADYPRVSEPVFELSHPRGHWVDVLARPAFLPQVVASAGLTAAPELSVPQLLQGADQVICACDPDASGASAFHTLLTLALGEECLDRCWGLDLKALDGQSIATALDTLHPYAGSGLHSLALKGRIKRYFDWNWTVNALVVLRRACTKAGVATDAPPVSKYALQLLYALRNGASISESGLFTLMERWKGTGRYAHSSVSSAALGSAASRGQIIFNLTRAGLLQWSEPHACELGTAAQPLGSISALGLALLNALHPDCEDLDLPFRLAAWMEQGADAYPAMDRYLRTVFGKQLRFKRRDV